MSRRYDAHPDSGSGNGETPCSNRENSMSSGSGTNRRSANLQPNDEDDDGKYGHDAVFKAARGSRKGYSVLAVSFAPFAFVVK